MRITFLGTWFARALLTGMQQYLRGVGERRENFVFDCGAGVLMKYNAMGIPPV